MQPAARPRVVIVPLVIAIDDPRAVGVPTVAAHLARPVGEALATALFDRADRDPGAPQPFGLIRAGVVWDMAEVCDQAPTAAEVEDVLGQKEAAVLNQEFKAAAELRAKANDMRRRQVLRGALPDAVARIARRALAFAAAHPAHAAAIDAAFPGEDPVDPRHYRIVADALGLRL